MDVGIIGIEYLFRYLFSHGMEEEAYGLLTSEKLGSFGYMKNHGATTLWEYWDGKKSQNHPMFGSPIKYLFYGLAGIRYETGFRSIVIRPALQGDLTRLKCSLTRPNVTVSVEYSKEGGKEKYVLTYTGDSRVTAELDGKRYEMASGVPLYLDK